MPDNLPDAVRAQLDKADAEFKEMYGDADDLPKVVHAPDPMDIVEELENKDQQTETSTTEAKTETDEPAPIEPVSDPAPAPVEEEVQPDPWEQRYKVLKGKYDAEVPRLQQQLSDTASQMETLTGQVEQLSQQRAAEETQSLQITAEEETAYGQDLIELTRKVAKAEAAKAAAQVSEQVQHLEHSARANSAVTDRLAHDRFIADVSTTVPDWEVIDARQDWLEWLGQYDPLLGSSRQAALDQAKEARDATRVAAVFDAFKAGISPAPTAQATSNPNVQQLVNPRSQTATPVNSGGQVRTYSEDDLKALYGARRKGEFTDEAWAKISAEIDNAMAEGRVR